LSLCVYHGDGGEYTLQILALHRTARAWPRPPWPRRLLVPCTALTLAVTLTACGSRPRPPADGKTPEPSRNDRGALVTALRTRRQDVLTALPLARRVERVIQGRPGQLPFKFEGFMSGRELVCVRALPPPVGDTTSVSTYVYDRGKLLGLYYELKTGGGVGAPMNLTVDALLGPDGAVLECMMTMNGKPRPMSHAQCAGMVRFMSSPAREAYQEVLAHVGD
jgi:hypothetical protein